MRKLLLFIFIVTAFTMNAQDSKFYLGVGLGYATAGGDFDEADGGIAIDFFDIGYRFNESWGVTAGLNSAGHSFDNVAGLSGTLGVATFAIGPMYSFPIGNMMWDFKPQYAFSMAGVIDYDASILDPTLSGTEADLKGNAFIIGNSLLFGDGRWQFSADVDYVMGNFDELELDGVDLGDPDFDYNSFRVGVGVRYNF